MSNTRFRGVEPVPITGVGCICSAGRDVHECMDTLFAGTRNIVHGHPVVAKHPRVCPVFPIPDEWLPQTACTGPQCRRCEELCTIAVRQALSDADLDPDVLKGKRVGVSIGTTVVGAMANEDFYSDFRDGLHPDMTPITQYLRANPGPAIARRFGLTGPAQTVTNACSSGTVAIGEAASWVRAGLCDIVIAGGSDKLSRLAYNGFLALRLMDDEPCKPFDRNRKGLSLGEGAAVVILEAEKSARARGALPKAVMTGYGNAMDAYHQSAPDPEGKGLARAITQALGQSGGTTKDIAFINAHGTATTDNDYVEGRLFKTMFANVPFCSTKGFTGHTLGAAGAIEAVFTIASLQAGRIPATAGFTTPDPNIGAEPTCSPERVRGDRALSCSLAFGGNNAAVVFEKAYPQ